MPEAVIVSTARSPIGRAMKGSLTECRPDDLAALIVKAALEKVPQLDPPSIEDLILGCGQPAGEAGYNLARVVAILAGLPDGPGVTVNRYCSSSLQAIRMAAHAIKAGEGDVFIAAGVETVSRYVTAWPTAAPTTRCSPTPRPAPPSARPADTWEPFTACPTSTSPWARRPRTSAWPRSVSRQEMDEFAALSQQRAVANQENGFLDGEITPLTTPDGTVVTKDDGPAPAPPSRSWPT